MSELRRQAADQADRAPDDAPGHDEGRSADAALASLSEPDSPWPAAIGHALGGPESHVEAWAYALNFADTHPLGEAGLENFILAEQSDLLRS